ncbi:MAG: hypothetical protein ACK55O_12005, partial [Phycisphaerales bacterium]
ARLCSPGDEPETSAALPGTKVARLCSPADEPEPSADAPDPEAVMPRPTATHPHTTAAGRSRSNDDGGTPRPPCLGPYARRPPLTT